MTLKDSGMRIGEALPLEKETLMLQRIPLKFTQNRQLPRQKELEQHLSQGKQNCYFWRRLFPCYPLTNWCWINLDKKIFLRNLDLIFKINFTEGLAIIYNLILLAKERKS